MKLKTRDFYFIFIILFIRILLEILFILLKRTFMSLFPFEIIYKQWICL